LLATGEIKCWGNNSSGQLGVSDNLERGSAPGQLGAELPAVAVQPPQRAAALALGTNHGCALLADRHLECWGQNDGQRLGVAADVKGGAAPLQEVVLGDVPTALALAAGDSHSCALLDSRQVECWGSLVFGELGLGIVADSDAGLASGLRAPLSPIDLGEEDGAPARVLGLSAGVGFTCAVLGSLHVKCWGQNHDGQLGIGDRRARGEDPADMGNELPSVRLE
jgi:alpha-tubulin suppressor-like RCC1 family protein